MAEKKTEAPQQKPKNVGAILTIVFAVLNLVVVGGGGFLVYSSTLAWQSPKITEADLQRELASEFDDARYAPYIFTMDKFTVNLGGEPKRTIRLEVSLQMLGKEGYEEIMSPNSRAKTRDKIVRVLNEKTFTDLETIQGKLFLKDAIAMEVNSVLREGVVKDVFFSDFVVQ
ncbi:MAG: flagellar basal body-associated FliL family protein [Bdellovibrionaceae bacterium]|nr:flagellar basal body-associated FliL family protein [Pseudobdellovibrionaceae bacterium]